MITLASAATELQRRLQSVPRPRPVLPRERERQLTERQRAVLDRLTEMFDEGFADLTMAVISARANCSLRTLYELAPSRDELVLMVADRNLWRIGHSARDAIRPDMAPLQAVRAYLRAATMAVSGTTTAFARDLSRVPAAQQLRDQHSAYLVAVTTQLLDLAVEHSDIPDLDTAALAHVMAGLGADLSAPDVIATLRSTPKQAADDVLDIILAGLTAADSEHRADRPPSPREP